MHFLDVPHRRTLHAMIKYFDFPQPCYSKNVKCPIAFFSEKIKNPPVVIENCAFRYRVGTIFIQVFFRTISILLHHLQTLIFLPCSAIQLWGFRCEPCWKKTNLWRRRELTFRNGIDQSEMHLLEISHCWIFKAGIKSFDFPIPSYAVSVKIFLKKIQTVAVEKFALK